MNVPSKLILLENYFFYFQESFESKIMDRLEAMQRNIDECREENKKRKEELKEKANKADTNRR